MVGKPERKKPLGKPRRRWDYVVIKDLEEIRWNGVELIHLAQDIIESKIIIYIYTGRRPDGQTLPSAQLSLTYMCMLNPALLGRSIYAGRHVRRIPFWPIRAVSVLYHSGNYIYHPVQLRIALYCLPIGPWAGVERFEKKPFALTGIEPRFLGFPAHSLVTTLPELP